MEIVQEEGGRRVRRQVDVYNLDMVISVGYRVNSGDATRFRIWTTQRLKEYLIQGYAINEKRLTQKQKEVQTLKDGIRILSRAIENKVRETDPEWLVQFAKSLELLDDYDHERLDTKGLSKQDALYPEIADYQKVINLMKVDFDSPIFGKEKEGVRRGGFLSVY